MERDAAKGVFQILNPSSGEGAQGRACGDPALQEEPGSSLNCSLSVAFDNTLGLAFSSTGVQPSTLEFSEPL